MGRLVSDYLAKISLKCCSCGNDIIRVRQGQLAVIKAGRGRRGGPVQRAWMKLRRVAKMAGRLHGSTSLVDSLCRDNKTNLHTGQLVPGRMSRLPPSLPLSPSLSVGEEFSTDRWRTGRNHRWKTVGKKIVGSLYPLFLPFEYERCVSVYKGDSCARLILQRKFWDGFVK